MMAGDQTGAAISAEIEQLGIKIGELLAHTLRPEPDVRKAAENSLLALETSTRLFGLATLNLTRRNDLPREVHISSAIAFKNFIKRHWHYDPNDESSDQVDMIDPEQRELIKRHITKFMIESPTHIQRQLSEAITIIGKSDFPEKWSWLIVELKTSLETNQDASFESIQGILQTAHSIFRRYRHELQSNRLWSEIRLVMEQFAPPFIARFKDLVQASTLPGQNPQRLAQIYQSLLLSSKIYLSLITQDLPEFFEDNINECLPLFLELLKVNVNLPDDLTIIEDMKSEICEIASLFVQRYSDAENLKGYTEKFAEIIWNLLVTTSQELRYDTLVSTAIRYLVTVAERPESRSMFDNEGVLKLICEKVILPNMNIREIDQELFEDDPEEYVHRDIEGSDVDTRRRAACDLVQALSKFLEAKMIEVLKVFIQDMFNTYEQNRKTNWGYKDLAVFIFSSLAIKGKTRQHGIVTVSQQLNIEEFYKNNVFNELSGDETHIGAEILKADALRYLTIFRNHISVAILVESMPFVLKLITSNNVVVRTYAAITLEKMLTMRDPSNPATTAFKPEQFEPLLSGLVNSLFQSLELPGAPENEHVMKAIMRLFSFSKSHAIVEFLPVVVPRMKLKLLLVAKNPSKPYFNHYLFETLALLIRAACSQESPYYRDEFEKLLFEIKNLVTSQDVQEFIPYVLQLLNIILRAQNVGQVSEEFVKLFDELMLASSWSKPANTKPQCDLLHSYIEKMGQVIISQNKLTKVLGVFQNLIASKATDHEALSLLQTMMIHLPAVDFDSRSRDIFFLIFQRLSGSKTTKFVKHTLIAFSLYCYLRGPDQLASAVNQLQDKIFGMILEKLYIADVKKVTGTIERKICTCGIIKILTQLPLIDNGAYNHLWSPLLVVLMEMLELPPEKVDDDDDHFADITDSLDFQAQYSKLNYANSKKDDPTKEVGDLKSTFAMSLASLSSKSPGFVPSMLQGMNENVSACLMNYCRAANVVIS